jgi:CheY-like chemotaxis protein/biotin operon repressor
VTNVKSASLALVLMMGNEHQICTSITSSLAKLGCQVEVVEGGETGLAALRDGSLSLIVIADFTPGLVGVDVMKAIRAADARVGIVLISSGNCEVGFTAARVGADVVLATPIDRDRFEAQALELIVGAQTRRRQVPLFRGLDGQTSSALVAAWTQAKQLETLQYPAREMRIELARHLARALFDRLTIFEFLAIASVLCLVNRDLVADSSLPSRARAHLEHVLHIHAQAVNPIIIEIVAKLESAGTNCRHVSEAQMSSSLGITRAVVWKALADVGLDFVQVRKAVAMRRALLQSREHSPVKLVALNLGYEDESHFMHDFARFFGISLQRFRGLIKN